VRREAIALAALLGGSGVLHFAKPRPYDRIIPRALPGNPRTWTYVSGAAELAVAAALTLPRTRRLGGFAAAALFAAILPANIQMAADQQTHKAKAIAYGRLPLQVPLIVSALRVARRPS
jgi:uncharacterized membrane protein